MGWRYRPTRVVTRCVSCTGTRVRWKFGFGLTFYQQWCFNVMCPCVLIIPNDWNNVIPTSYRSILRYNNAILLLGLRGIWFVLDRPSLFIRYSRRKPYFKLIVKIINVANVNFRRQFNDERASQKSNTKDGYRVKRGGAQPHTDFSTFPSAVAWLVKLCRYSKTRMITTLFFQTI